MSIIDRLLKACGMYKEGSEVTIEKKKNSKHKDYNLYIQEHNAFMRSKAEEFKKEMREKPTKAEAIVNKVLRESELKDQFVFQYAIYIYKGRKIERFYIADFCFYKQKVILELDGGYHFTPEQNEKDLLRTRELEALGYKILRLDNDKVLNSKQYSGLISGLQRELNYDK